MLHHLIDLQAPRAHSGIQQFETEHTWSRQLSLHMSGLCFESKDSVVAEPNFDFGYTVNFGLNLEVGFAILVDFTNLQSFPSPS